MTTTQLTRQFLAFTVRFVIAAWGVFVLFVTEDIHLGSATIPVAFVSAILLTLLVAFLEPRLAPILRIRIDPDRRIYINDIPYYRIVLVAGGVAILSALLLLATGQFGSFVHNVVNGLKSFNP